MGEILILYIYVASLIGRLISISVITPFNVGIFIATLYGLYKIKTIFRNTQVRKYVFIIYVFFFSLLFTSLFSDDYATSLKWLFYYFSFCILLIISLLVRSRETIKRILNLLFIFQVIYLGIALLEVTLGIRFVDISNDTFINNAIPVGFSGNANGLASVMVISFSLIYFSLTSTKLKYIALISSSVVLMLTMSRGCVIAFAMYIILYFLFQLKNKKINFSNSYKFAVASLLVVAICIVAYNNNLSEDAENVLNRSLMKVSLVPSMYDLNVDESTNIRASIIYYVLNDWEKFIFGKGPGMSHIVTIQHSGFSTNPHNLWLELYIDGGIATLGIFLGLYLLILNDLYKILQKNYLDDINSNFVRASILTLIIYPIISVINSGVFGSAMMYLPFSFALINISVASDEKK